MDSQHLVRPKKALGQHFLINLPIAERIAKALPKYPEAVLEIGPGMGVLTQFLIQSRPQLSAVEIDAESVQYLHLHYPDLLVRQEDFLRMDLSTLAPSFAIIGNFPYNISSQILFRLLEHRDQIPTLVGMFQKEVAQRIAAPPGSKTYGILSVLLQAFYTIEYLFTVDEQEFNPPPKVKSAVIRIQRNQVHELPCNEQGFVQLVKAGFNQRRKTLRNALSALGTDKSLYVGPWFDQRAEQLSVEDFVKLTQWWDSCFGFAHIKKKS